VTVLKPEVITFISKTSPQRKDIESISLVISREFAFCGFYVPISGFALLNDNECQSS